jgi:hypothetical protein
MFEGSQMSPDAMALPRILALGEWPFARSLSVTETHESIAQAREFDVEPRVEDVGGGVDTRRNTKSLPVEARPHDAIEANDDSAAGESSHETDGEQQQEDVSEPATRGSG